MMKRLLRDRRGVSIAEVVVAMTMVLIITGAAMSVQIASTRADVAYRYKYQALSACENAVACVRFAGDSAETLAEALGKAGFVTSNGVSTHKSGDYEVVVAFEEERYVVRYNGEIIYEYIQYE